MSLCFPMILQVGVGLVMIPLPTPFGAVVASSGLAVLGTEFKEAKEMNDRLIEGVKSTVSVARDRIVKGIESMDGDEDNDISEWNDSTTNMRSSSDSQVIKVPLPVPDKAGDTDDGDEEGADTPTWLHMNPIEQKRQDRIAREKYRMENQTVYERNMEYWTKKTGSFLSRNLLPLLKGGNVEEQEDATKKRKKNDFKVREEEGYLLIGSGGDDGIDYAEVEEASVS
jgi:hypothetical protein